MLFWLICMFFIDLIWEDRVWFVYVEFFKLEYVDVRIVYFEGW